MPYTYEYPRMAVTADAVVFELSSPPRVLLIRRASEPFKGKWAIPGGFVDMDESAQAGAVRELKEETGVDGVALQFFGHFDSVDRDPRQRTLSLAFWGAVEPGAVKVMGSDDASEAGWHAVDALPELAFDHQLILEKAIAAFGSERP